MPNQDDRYPFSFLCRNQRERKPRTRGVTEIRGPYYSVMGPRYLTDVLETMGDYVDSLKFAGGSFSLIPQKALSELIELCHAHEVLVSTGGFIEHVVMQGASAVSRYVEQCQAVGFDIIEVSCGFITIPPEDWLRLVEAVQKSGMRKNFHEDPQEGIYCLHEFVEET